MRIFPTRSQWIRFRETRLTGLLPESLTGRVDIQTNCISCLMPVSISEAFDIRIGCLVKVTEEEVIPAETVIVAGIAYRIDERVKLSSRVFPMNMRGAGCAICGIEHLKQFKIVADNVRVKDSYMVKVPVVECVYEGLRYTKREGRWYHATGIATPTSMWKVLNEAFSERKVEERLTTENPTKPIPFIDVTEEVLKMPKGLPPSVKDYEASTD